MIHRTPSPYCLPPMWVTGTDMPIEPDDDWQDWAYECRTRDICPHCEQPNDHHENWECEA